MGEILALIAGILVFALIALIVITVFIDTMNERTSKSDGRIIIKRGKIPTKKVKCQYCHSTIGYTPDAVWHGLDGPIIVCPVCKENTNLEPFETKGEQQ